MKKDHANIAKKIRKTVLNMIYQAKASHIGSCFSAVDILSVLYNGILNIDPKQPTFCERDRFILSKGHAAAVIYAVLAEKNFFPKAWLDNYCANGQILGGHINHRNVPGVEVSTGSLGHGLSIGCGIALAAKRESKKYRTYVLLSDGECNEGSVWEAALFAAHHKLNNLVAIIDYNKIQAFGRVEEILRLEPLFAKWTSFNWEVREIDGHNYGQIETVLSDVPFSPAKPSLIIANTIKGKGVSFMENKLLWHYKSPDTEQFNKAMLELE